MKQNQSIFKIDWSSAGIKGKSPLKVFQKHHEIDHEVLIINKFLLCSSLERAKAR